RCAAVGGLVARTLELARRPYTVVGVMPRGFSFPTMEQLWVPLAPYVDQGRGSRSLSVIGRLRPGATVEGASREVAAIAARLAAEYPPTNGGRGAEAEAYRDAVLDDTGRDVLILFGAVSLVLLIACANVGNLLLARAIARGPEIALRGALGATRGRVVRQMLTESAVIALAGAALGVGVAVWGLDLVARALPADGVPFWWRFDVDGRALGFSTALALLTSLAFGGLPALTAARADLQSVLKEGGRRALAGRPQRRMRAALVVGEMALSVVLLAGASLMTQSLSRLRRLDPGFRPERVLSLQVNLGGTAYDSGAARAAFLERALERVRALPGVDAAGVANYAPFSGSAIQGSFYPEGVPVEAGNEPITLIWPSSPGYLTALGVPLKRGRLLAPADMDTAGRVAVISETMARRFWPDSDPIGRRFSFGRLGMTPDWFTVVGVAGDVMLDPLDRQPWNQAYVPYPTRAVRTLAVTVRSDAGEPGRLANSVTAAIRAIDPGLAVYEVWALDDLYDQAIWSRRFYGWLFGTFAAVALVLAAVGVYGVIAYAVAQRTREIGVRVAIGATGADVMRLVLGDGVRLALGGVAAGVAGAFAATRLLTSLLVDTDPLDPLTFFGVPAALVAVALLASYAPARRAMRVDPMTALRAD
ncbi:MAG TPA: ABC transporter permease, partial [Gemmatimonadaceae bacterium]|nr:ABC transporter permease [Gemmatimonadaceae bacterium]